MDKITYRLVNSSDLPLIHHWYHHNRHLMGASQQVHLEDFHSDHHQRWYMVFYEDVPFCIAGILHIQPKSCELSLLIGEENYRHKGLGTIVMKTLLDELFLHRHFHRVSFWTIADNQQAIKFHHKMGFTQEGCLRDAYEDQGQYYDLILFSMLEDEYIPYGQP